MRAVLLVLWLAVSLPAGGKTAAAQSADEAGLIAFLDKEYAPGMLRFGNRGRSPSGAYIWGATFHRELRKPLEKLTAHCGANGGTMMLLLSAGRLQTGRARASLAFASKSFEVGHREIWGWEAREHDSGPAQSEGFNAVIPRQLITGRTKTIASADADPPMGLFGCKEAGGTVKWAATIMPGAYAGTGWFFMSIRPVTGEWLESRREAAVLAAQRVRDGEVAIARRQRDEVAYMRSENVRLAPFRRAIGIGSQTNCGLVIDDRGAVVQVQMPSGNVSPDGERVFWVKRDELADYPFPKGCTYGK